LLRGVELVRDQFLAKLEALGVRRVDALGQPFDATSHEAVSVAPVTDETQDGRVVAVTREGYAIGEELLRPASVVVGRFDG
jgi:molecular chaperone GrpE